MIKSEGLCVELWPFITSTSFNILKLRWPPVTPQQMRIGQISQKSWQTFILDLFRTRRYAKWTRHHLSTHNRCHLHFVGCLKGPFTNVRCSLLAWDRASPDPMSFLQGTWQGGQCSKTKTALFFLSKIFHCSGRADTPDSLLVAQTMRPMLGALPGKEQNGGGGSHAAPPIRAQNGAIGVRKLSQPG